MESAEVIEIKRHFNVVAERLEGHIQPVAEGLAGLNEKLDRDISTLSAEIHEEFEETRAMIGSPTRSRTDGFARSSTGTRTSSPASSVSKRAEP